MRILRFFVIAVFLGLAGCGYSTRSALPADFRTIYVPEFKNKIAYTTESANRHLYIPLLEVRVRDAIINRFLFDGNLRIGQPDSSDLELQGELVSYERSPIRFTENDDVEEYRVHIVINMILKDEEDHIVWEEANFTGEATYFVRGPLASSEDVAVEEALTDLARRVVERTIENW
jgi:hypothetical protein